MWDHWPVNKLPKVDMEIDGGIGSFEKFAIVNGWMDGAECILLSRPRRALAFGCGEAPLSDTRSPPGAWWRAERRKDCNTSGSARRRFAVGGWFREGRLSGDVWGLGELGEQSRNVLRYNERKRNQEDSQVFTWGKLSCLSKSDLEWASNIYLST